ncbi:MAG: thioesterase family protein [Pseudonocardia sp.]|nr:thioesterase family protein [Pseudonocardia sp.]
MDPDVGTAMTPTLYTADRMPPATPDRPGGFDDVPLLTVRFARSPVEGGLGLTPVEIGRGRVLLRTLLGPGTLDSAGRVSTLLVSVAVDTALGIAVHTSTPQRTGGPTVELRVDHHGAPAPGATCLYVEGLGRFADSTCGTGTVTVRDDLGTLVAGATGTMVVDPLPTGVHRRVWMDVTGVPKLDLAALPPGLDGTPTDGADPAELRVSLSRTAANLRGDVHGGMVMAVAHAAQARFAAAAPAPSRPLTTTVDYLRPLPPDSEVSCRSVVVRDGRRFRTIRTELVREDGKIAATASGTVVILPND